MCKQETALDMIKARKGKGGLTNDQIKLAEAQCDDYKRTDKRMSKIETEVADIKVEINLINNKTDKILSILEHPKSSNPLKSIKELFSNKLFLIFLFLALSLACGIPISEIVSSYIKL